MAGAKQVYILRARLAVATREGWMENRVSILESCEEKSGLEVSLWRIVRTNYLQVRTLGVVLSDGGGCGHSSATAGNATEVTTGDAED